MRQYGARVEHEVRKRPRRSATDNFVKDRHHDYCPTAEKTVLKKDERCPGASITQVARAVKSAKSVSGIPFDTGGWTAHKIHD